MTAIFGCRSLLTIATKRVSGLRRVAHVQIAVRGTVDDKKRRRKILLSKIVGLIIDLLAVSIISVIAPGSIVLAGKIRSVN
jgi:hypothetical protein